MTDVDDDMVIIDNASLSHNAVPQLPLAGPVNERPQTADTTSRIFHSSPLDSTQEELWLCEGCNQRAENTPIPMHVSGHLTAPSCDAWENKCRHDRPSFQTSQSTSNCSSVHRLQYQQIPTPTFRDDLVYRAKTIATIGQHNKSQSPSPVSRPNVSAPSAQH